MTVCKFKYLWHNCLHFEFPSRTTIYIIIWYSSLFIMLVGKPKLLSCHPFGIVYGIFENRTSWNLIRWELPKLNHLLPTTGSFWVRKAPQVVIRIWALYWTAHCPKYCSYFMKKLCFSLNSFKARMEYHYKLGSHYPYLEFCPEQTFHSKLLPCIISGVLSTSIHDSLLYLCLV